MMGCDVLRRHIDAVIDDEIGPDAMLECEQHLASCEGCRVELAFARAFKRRVREACGAQAADLTAPAHLRVALKAALDEEDRQQVLMPPAEVLRPAAETSGWGAFGIRSVRARYALPATAAAVALAVVAAREGGNPVASDELTVDAASTAPASIFDEVVNRHAREHPPEITGPVTKVATWFQDKVEFPVRPIEFAEPDVRLVGARLSNVRDREAAAFYYDVRGQRVTVMVFERSTPASRFARPARVQGRSLWYGYGRGRPVSIVQHQGLNYAIAGDLEERDLLRLTASARLH